MTQSADELVTEFCALWSNPDPEQILSYFTEDAVYHNIPMPPAEGRSAIKEFLGLMLDGFAGIDFTVHRQFSQGDVVMNERTDVMRRTDGGAPGTTRDGRLRGARRPDRRVAGLLRHGDGYGRIRLELGGRSTTIFSLRHGVHFVARISGAGAATFLAGPFVGGSRFACVIALQPDVVTVELRTLQRRERLR